LQNQGFFVIEDDFLMRFAATEKQERSDVKTFTAMNENEAIEQLQQTQLDLAFMDIVKSALVDDHMISAIRADPKLRELFTSSANQIVRLTSKAMGQEKQKIIYIGADNDLINAAITWSASNHTASLCTMKKAPRIFIRGAF
jgi:CheY-like chemotaxis protein